MALDRAKVGISSLVERQMRNWEINRSQDPDDRPGPTTNAKETKFFITISRECGCGGGEIASKLAERTGFSKFDHEILDFMVREDDVRRKLYETLDDRTVGWIEQICSTLTFGPSVNEAEYFNRLCHGLLAICHNTHAIILGRAANFILPRECGLAVRMVAPTNFRLERYAGRIGKSLKEAQKEMFRIDQERSQFIENHFGKFAYDLRRYDLGVNVSQYTQDQVVDIIITALKAKGGPELKLPVDQGPGKQP